MTPSWGLSRTSREKSLLIRKCWYDWCCYFIFLSLSLFSSFYFFPFLSRLLLLLFLFLCRLFQSKSVRFREVVTGEVRSKGFQFLGGRSQGKSAHGGCFRKKLFGVVVLGEVSSRSSFQERLVSSGRFQGKLVLGNRFWKVYSRWFVLGKVSPWR